jgi:hypothetical protein
MTNEYQQTEEWIKVQPLGLKEVSTRFGESLKNVRIKKPFWVSARNKYYKWYQEHELFEILEKTIRPIKRKVRP